MNGARLTAVYSLIGRELKRSHANISPRPGGVLGSLVLLNHRRESARVRPAALKICFCRKDQNMTTSWNYPGAH